MMIAAAPQILDHPCCDVINKLPWGFFLLVHVALFALGAYFAYRMVVSGRSVLAWAFGLFALAEISYMTYHLDWTVFLFAHTISEVLDLVAFILVFVAATQRSLSANPNANASPAASR